MTTNGLDINAPAINLITGKPPQKPIFYESMTQIICPHTKARIRVWRKTLELMEYPDEAVLLVFKMIPDGVSMKELIEIISSVEGVVAIELTDANGLGAVAYYEW